jgi:hypothetical protein
VQAGGVPPSGESNATRALRLGASPCAQRFYSNSE